ncbi:hypothetical protein E4U43_006230, partial [Claviceps pusilla]
SGSGGMLVGVAVIGVTVKGTGQKQGICSSVRHRVALALCCLDDLVEVASSSVPKGESWYTYHVPCILDDLARSPLRSRSARFWNTSKACTG